MFLMILGMFVNLIRHYMVSNKYLVLGLRNSLLWSPLLDFANSYGFALFVKHIDSNHIIHSLYVDDMIITGDGVDSILTLKVELAK